MTTSISFGVKLMDKNLIRLLNQVEGEIRKLTGCDVESDLNDFVAKELTKARELFKNSISDEDLSNGNFPNPYYKELNELNKLWSRLIITFLIDFLKIFPHRREIMSLKYIGKIFNFPIDLLESWFKLESINIIHKKSGKFIDALDAMKFMRKISDKSYKLTITTKNI